MNEELIIQQKEAPLGWIVINRPAQRNALSEPMWQGLATAVNDLSADNDLSVILITGGLTASPSPTHLVSPISPDDPIGSLPPTLLGSHDAFIAGADISELQRQATMIDPQVDFTVSTLQAITRAPKPVIAMINGHCYGGGVLVALACDLRLASESARFAIPAVKIGAAYPVKEGIERLVNIIGTTAAADLLLSGRTIDAQEALRIGLINRVVARQALEEETRQYALALAEGAPLTLRAHKLALQNLLRAPTDRDDATALQAMIDCYRSQDFAEGIAAFLAKRQPRFTGA